MNNIKMPDFHRIDVSEGIDVNKTSTSKECDICHCWYFLSERFKFQSYLFNRCHNLLMSINLSNIAILKIINTDYCCTNTRVTKSEAIESLQN